MAVARQHVHVARAQRAIKQLVAHRAAVDEQELRDRCAARRSGQAGIAAQSQPVARGIDAQRVVDEFPPQQPAKPPGQRIKHVATFRIGPQHHAPLIGHVPEGETHTGLRHRKTADHIGDRLHFGAVAAQEFQPCGGGIEQIAQFHDGAP